MMALDSLTAAETGLIRWYRSLDMQIRQAVDFWLLTGDTSLLTLHFTHQHHLAAA
jgi:hypothetical protein